MRGIFTGFHALRFRERLLVALMLSAIFPTIIIGIVSYAISSRQMELQIQSAQQLMLKNAADNVSMRLGDAKRVSELTQFYFAQLMLQSTGRESSYDNLIRIQTLKSNLALLRSRFDVPRIQVFLSDENIYAHEGVYFYPFNGMSAALRELGVTGELSSYTSTDNFCFKPMDISRLMREGSDSIRLYRTIRSVDGKEVVAGFFVDINLADFGLFAESLVDSYPAETGAGCMIVNETGDIFYSTRAGQTNTPLDDRLFQMVAKSGGDFFNHDGNMVLSRGVPGSGWMLISWLPLRYLRSRSILISGFAIFATIVTILVAVVASIVISSALTRKIELLSNAMNGLTPELGINSLRISGELIQTGCGESSDEIDQLIQTYHAMLNRIEGLMQEIVRHETLAEKQRFALLQAQIKPHFLYNVMESINACILSGKMQEASRMVHSLSWFYRGHLSQKQDLVSIRDEIQSVTLYLQIEEACYLGKLFWEVRVDEQIQDFVIPRFTLQPIVENCVAHGMKGIEGPLRIAIYGGFEQDEIRLTVTDNGLGIEPETIAWLEQMFGEGRADDSTGYSGMANVNARIQYQFSKRYGIRVKTNAQGGGTCVIISAPPTV